MSNGATWGSTGRGWPPRGGRWAGGDRPGRPGRRRRRRRARGRRRRTCTRASGPWPTSRPRSVRPRRCSRPPTATGSTTPGSAHRSAPPARSREPPATTRWRSLSASTAAAMQRRLPEARSRDHGHHRALPPGLETRQQPGPPDDVGHRLAPPRPAAASDRGGTGTPQWTTALVRFARAVLVPSTQAPSLARIGRRRVRPHRSQSHHGPHRREGPSARWQRSQCRRARAALDPNRAVAPVGRDPRTGRLRRRLGAVGRGHRRATRPSTRPSASSPPSARPPGWR